MKKLWGGLKIIYAFTCLLANDANNLLAISCNFYSKLAWPFSDTCSVSSVVTLIIRMSYPNSWSQGFNEAVGHFGPWRYCWWARSTQPVEIHETLWKMGYDSDMIHIFWCSVSSINNGTVYCILDSEQMLFEFQIPKEAFTLHMRIEHSRKLI